MAILKILLTLCICYYIGQYRENKHYKSIKKREVALYKQPYISFAKNIKSSRNVKRCCLVSSSVCIACDYFKMFISSIKSLLGGNLSCYETVLDRGRREAILRIREQALRMRADIIVNTKVETILLTSRDELNQITNPKVCVLAYGTAIKYE